MTAILNSSVVFSKAFMDHAAVIQSLELQQPLLQTIAEELAKSIKNRNTILWCGNGGSAADSQHLAAELVGRFRRNRRGLPSIALTTDTSILTAIANDFGYEDVFRRQVEALGEPGDVLVGISTSGNSKNVCGALELARDMGLITVAMTGLGGGKMAALADHSLYINSTDTARVQEAHILVGHMFCDWIELTVLDGRDHLRGSQYE
jgi:D-sedoheptulose 7-phosphate isomerase